MYLLFFPGGCCWRRCKSGILPSHTTPHPPPQQPPADLLLQAPIEHSLWVKLLCPPAPRRRDKEGQAEPQSYMSTPHAYEQSRPHCRQLLSACACHRGNIAKSALCKQKIALHSSTHRIIRSRSICPESWFTNCRIVSNSCSKRGGKGAPQIRDHQPPASEAVSPAGQQRACDIDCACSSLLVFPVRTRALSMMVRRCSRSSATTHRRWNLSPCRRKMQR